MLTFDALRAANRARLPQFKNAQGEPAHSVPDGSDWSLGDWVMAFVGEVGEACNILKKMKRGDFNDTQMKAAQISLENEFADAQTYLDLLAFRAGVDLGAATMRKFNAVSERVGSTVQLNPPPFGWYRYDTDEFHAGPSKPAYLKDSDWIPLYQL